jgi:uncharacterized membrane-anchored protein YhcB (DUF1043 family)
MKWSSPMFLAIGLVIGLSVGLVLTPLISSENDAKIAMWLEVVHRVCTSVGGLGTFVALIIVIQQFTLLRTQSELVQKNTRASMDGLLYARLDSFNKFIVEHFKEYATLDQSFERDTPPEDRPKLHHLCDMGFTFYEEIYKHHVRYRLLDTEDWDEWQQNMIHYFGKPYVRGYWNTVAGRYAKSFQTFANDLVAGIASK